MAVPLTLLQRFENYVISEKLITPGMKLILGLSGGADSTALAYLMYHLRSKLQLSLLAVHVNHNLRGEASAADEVFVKRLCSRLNIATIVQQVKFDTTANLESQARNKRREILQQTLASYKFDYIVLAHQMDDQAETVLMNLARGAGITGLGGIKPVAGHYLRPLLTFTKAEIVKWLDAQKFTYQHDESNANNAFTRNRIRNELLPWMTENLNPAILQRLSSQARTFRQTDDWMKAHNVKLMKKLLVQETNEQIILDLTFLKKLSEIEQFYALRACYSQLAKTDHEFFMHSFEEIARIFYSEGSKITRLAHNITVIKQYNELIFTTLDFRLRGNDGSRGFGKKVGQSPPADGNGNNVGQSPSADRNGKMSEVYQEMTIDFDKSHFVFLGWRFSLKIIKNKPHHLENTRYEQHILLDFNTLSLPLKLRTRIAGDTFVPAGMNHTRKLKEFFIDEKVPLLDRDKVPILTDAEDILWVLGHRGSAKAICDSNCHRILYITAEPVETGRKREAKRAGTNTGEKHEFYEL